MVCSIFIELYNHYYCLLLEHFITPKWNTIHISSHSPFPPTPLVLGNYSSLFVSACPLFTGMTLFSGASYFLRQQITWNHTHTHSVLPVVLCELLGWPGCGPEIYLEKMGLNFWPLAHLDQVGWVVERLGWWRKILLTLCLMPAGPWPQ